MDVRFIRPGEDKVCNDFHNHFFRDDRSLKQWRWCFLPKEDNQNTIPFVVVDDDDRIVGTQAFIPIRLVDERGVFPTVKSEETLVHPDLRGQGYFEKMYTVMFDYMKTRDYHCIWGFTAAIKALIKIGFLVPVGTSQLFLPFSASAVTVAVGSQVTSNNAGIGSKIKAIGYKLASLLAAKYASFKSCRARKRVSASAATNRIELKTLDKPPDDAGTISKRFVRQWGGVTIYRDAAYLQWRLFENPFARSIFRAAYCDNQLIGWCAFTIGDDGMGYLVDIMVTHEESDITGTAVSLLLQDAVDTLRAMGASGVRGWKVNNHPFDNLITETARKVGFYNVKRGYFAVLYINDQSDRRDFLAQFDNWFVTRIFTEGVTG